MHRRTFVTAATGGLAATFLTRRANSDELATRVQPSLAAGAFAAARRYAETRFGGIAYVERGVGRAALFLHGFPLNSFQWRGALATLARERRCIAPDFMALGHTEVASGRSVAPDAQRAMLVALLDRLSIRDVDIVANDSGGAVAQLFVARHPERVRSLLLTNCDTEHDCPPAALLPVIELSRAGRFVDDWLAPWLADKALARSAGGIGGMCYADPAHPTDEAIEYYFSPLVGSPRRKALVHQFALALEANSLDGIAPALARFGGPVRVVWGTGDTIFARAGAAHLDRSFRNSRGVRLLPGRKLFFPEEATDVIAEEARRLWHSA